MHRKKWNARRQSGTRHMRYRVNMLKIRTLCWLVHLDILTKSLVKLHEKISFPPILIRYKEYSFLNQFLECTSDSHCPIGKWCTNMNFCQGIVLPSILHYVIISNKFKLIQLLPMSIHLFSFTFNDNRTSNIYKLHIIPVWWIHAEHPGKNYLMFNLVVMF